MEQENPVIRWWVTTKDQRYLMEKGVTECKPTIETKALELNADIHLKLNISKQHQKMLGMGYSFEHSSCHNLLTLPKGERTRALELLLHPTQGNMNLWRLCIGTADFTGTPWYSYCDAPPLKDIKNAVEHVRKEFSTEKDEEMIIPIIKAALEVREDIVFFASPWSPPAWMKSTQNMCGGRLLPKFYPAYAEYLALFVQDYTQRGIPIYAITVQNEPLHNTKSMPTCKWTAEEEQTFIRDHLGPLFKKKQFHTQIWCYDHNFSVAYRPAKYPQTLLQDPKAARFVDGIAFHHYDLWGWGRPKCMKKIDEKFPTIPSYFTEGSLFGLWGCLRLTRYLKNNAASYNGWVPCIDTDGKPNNGPFKCHETIIQRDVATNTLLINWDYYALAQFTRFIVPGSIRFEITGNRKRGFESIGFVTPKHEICLIFTNKSSKPRRIEITHKDVKITLQILPKSVSTYLIKEN